MGVRAKLVTRLAWVALMLSDPDNDIRQATIAGIVRDTSGAVLPGVTVEAASPALIEKVRSVVSDGSGQYQIVNLVPGTYTVTFTLPGFNTVKREGVGLAGSFTAKIDAEMRVGALTETITVTGETPIRGCAEHEAAAGHRPRSHRYDPDQPHGLRPGVADSRGFSRRSHQPGCRRIVVVGQPDRQRRGPWQPHGRPDHVTQRD